MELNKSSPRTHEQIGLPSRAMWATVASTRVSPREGLWLDSYYTGGSECEYEHTLLQQVRVLGEHVYMYVRAALAINGVAIELRAARLILRPVKEEETRERGGYELRRETIIVSTCIIYLPAKFREQDKLKHFAQPCEVT